MKSFTIKNYKGNIIESLARFQKKYPGSHILEAYEEDSALKIKAEADDDNWEQIPDMGSFSNALHMAIDSSAADWYDDFLTDPKNNEQVEQFLEDLKRFAKWFDLPNISSKYQKEAYADLKKGIEEFERDWKDYHNRHSSTNESLGRHEDDELYFDVLNWFYDNFSAQNDITDQQWKDLANDIDKNAEVFMKLLDDLGLQGADDEVKDRAHELLVDFVDAEL